jgi:putative chitinase
MISINRKIFYNTIRPFVNLTTQNVIGFEKHLDWLEANPTETNQAAYGLATSYWETSATMHPIREYGSEAYLKKKPYYPFVGMGLIQTTWRENWIKAAKFLGLPEDHFIKNPQDLLRWAYALPLLFLGMETGLYTGKKLTDYIDNIDESDAEDLKEYVAARHVVNGTDKATQIGQLAIYMEHGLRNAGYLVTSTKPVILTPATVPVTPVPPIPVVVEKPVPISPGVARVSWVTMIVNAIVSIIKSMSRSGSRK